MISVTTITMAWQSVTDAFGNAEDGGADASHEGDEDEHGVGGATAAQREHEDAAHHPDQQQQHAQPQVLQSGCVCVV